MRLYVAGARVVRVLRRTTVRGLPRRVECTYWRVAARTVHGALRSCISWYTAAAMLAAAPAAEVGARQKDTGEYTFGSVALRERAASTRIRSAVRTLGSV